MKTKFKKYILALYYMVFHPVVSWRVFSSRTKKRIIRITAVILIVTISIPASLWYQKYRANVAEAAWWNDLWLYRKAITVSNSSGSELTDFQVKILDNKDLSSDISAGKIQSDLDDLRFTDINGVPVPYWIEDNTAASVDVWIKAPKLPTTGATFYMYYGNTQATAASDGRKVFEFFDDFSDSSWSNANWTAYNSNWSVGSGVYTTTPGGDYSMANFTSLNDYIVNAKVKVNSGTHGGLVVRAATGRIYYEGEMEAGGSSQYVYRMDSPSTYTLLGSTSVSGVTNGTWYDVSFAAGGSSLTWKNLTKGTTTTATDATYATGKPGVWAWTDGNTSFDDFRVRKYASADPSAGTPASEEKGTTPVGYWSFDEGTGSTAYDGTSNAKNGTLTNMSSTADPVSGWQMGDKCVSGNCIGFDNVDDGVSVANQNFTSLTDYTMCAWINPKGNHKNYTGTIMSSGDWNNTHWAFGVSQNNTSLQTRKADGVNSPTWSYTFPLNKWSYACITRSGTSVQAYVDGKNIGSYTGTTGNLISNATNTMIGRETYAGGYFDFNGKIDEPKIYNYARSINQIKNDYNAGVAGMAKANEGTEASIGGKSAAWLTQGLVGHWKMDEASWNGTSGEVKDASGNGNNGTANGSAATAAGKFGNGGSFNGTSSYISVPNSSNLTVQGDLTMAAWIKASSKPASDRWVIAAKTDTASLWPGYEWAMNSSGALSIWTSNGSSGAWSDDSGYDLSDSNWHLVMARMSGTTMQFYVDGVAKGSFTKTVPGSNTNIFTIGRLSYSSGRFWNGYIDEVRVYNRALSPQEIQQLYNYAPGPVGYWNMDEGSGGTAKDISGSGYDGTLVNSPVWTKGKYNNALQFDGSSNYVSTNLDAQPSAMANTTWEAWVYPTRTGYGSRQTFFSTDDGGYDRGLIIESNTSNFGIFTGSGVWQPTAVTLNTWQHVTVVYTPTNIEFYKNGVKYSYGSAPTTGSTANKFWIARNPGYSEYFQGSMDEIKVYNYARTAKQITEDMNASHPVGGSPVGSQVAYWKFNEGQGNTAYDYSGKGHNGTLTNGPTWTQSGKIGKGLQLVNANGQTGQFIEVTDNLATTDANLKTNDTMTFSTWINPNSTQTAGNSPRIFGSGNSGSQHQYIVQLSSLSGGKYKIQYTFHNGTTYYYFATSSYILPADTWSHLAITCKYQTYCKAYINGNLAETTATVYTGDASPANYFCIGGRSGGYDGIQALMDEFKIYNYALSDDDIKIDFNQGKSLVMGGTGTTSDGKTMDFSAARGYCPPGNTEGNCGAGLNPAPVGEWKLYEGTGTSAKDTSGNSNDGTLTNGPTWRTAKENNAVYFDGSDDYIEMNAPISSGSPFTISMWYYPTRINSSYDMLYSGTDNIDLQLFFNSSTKVLTTSIENVEKSAGLTLNSGTINRWYHIVWTYDNSRRKVYINGMLTADDADTTAFVKNDTKVRLGALVNGGGYPIQGLIDQVQVFDYARTPSQVTWDYNRGGPVGWWRFDEGQGSSAYDYSGNGNTGTLTNMDPPNDWVAGKNNGALDLDGSNDFVSVPNNAALNMKGDFSISAWVYPKSIGGNAQRIVDTATNGSTTGAQYCLKLGTNSPYTDISGFVLKSGTWYETRSNTGYITQNQWQHIVYIYNSTTGYGKIYYNGQEVSYANQQTVTGLGDLTQNLNIGLLHHDASSYLYGNQKIDDLRIYNYALSAEQIKQVYNNGAVNFR